MSIYRENCEWKACVKAADSNVELI